MGAVQLNASVSMLKKPSGICTVNYVQSFYELTVPHTINLELYSAAHALDRPLLVTTLR